MSKSPAIEAMVAQLSKASSRLYVQPMNRRKRTEELAKSIKKATLKLAIRSGCTAADLARIHGLTDSQMRAVLVHHKLVDQTEVTSHE